MRVCTCNRCAVLCARVGPSPRPRRRFWVAKCPTPLCSVAGSQLCKKGWNESKRMAGWENSVTTWRRWEKGLVLREWITRIDTPRFAVFLCFFILIHIFFCGWMCGLVSISGDSIASRVAVLTSPMRPGGAGLVQYLLLLLLIWYILPRTNRLDVCDFMSSYIMFFVLSCVVLYYIVWTEMCSTRSPPRMKE